MQRGGTAFDFQTAGQDAFVAAAGGDAILHHLPDFQQAGAGFSFRAPGAFVGQHHLADGQTIFDAMTKKILGAFEREGQGGGVFDDAVGAGGVFIDHKTAADRVVLAAADLQARCVEGAENHAVGVIGQRFANHRQVFFLVERNAVFAEQVQASAATNVLQAGGDGFGVNGVRMLAFQAEQHGLVAAVALAGGAERAVQLDFDASGCRQQVFTAQTFDEARGGAHRADGVGAGGADANLEQVEHA
ncbi:hypothetical protein D3C71_1235780 [compost metagenome]